MGYSSEERDQLSTPLCGARKKNGERCRAFAGQKTDHLGVGPCAYHGGATTNHKKSAVSIEARRRMVTLGTPIEDVTAPSALMDLLRASAGHVSWLQSEVAALDSLAGHEAQVLVKLYDQERDRLARVGEACVRAGVAEHMVRMERTRAEQVLRIIRGAAGDIGLERRQLEALGLALRKRLAEAGADPERDAEAADARLAELRAEIAEDEEGRIARAAERRARELSGLVFPPDEMVPGAPEAA